MSNENLNNNGNNNGMTTNDNAGAPDHSLGRWEVLDADGNMVQGNIVGAQDSNGDGKEDTFQVDINGDGLSLIHI